MRPGGRRGFRVAAVALASLTLTGSCKEASTTQDSALVAGDDWRVYNGNAGSTHYSTLSEITARNVNRLRVAWTYDTGDVAEEGDETPVFDMQSNPLVVDGRLYFVSPKGRLIALDAATGREAWVFDPAGGKPVHTRQRQRGVAYWSSGGQSRIYFTFRSELFAVDAQRGVSAAGFGDQGRVDLRAGLGRDPASISVTSPSPGVVYKDLLILGSAGNAPGHIRAYDVRTGKLRWVFHTIPHPGEAGHESWPGDAWKAAMGANNWAGFSLDPQRGLVFVPTASGGAGNKDFYGADRAGDNLFADSLVALDAATGRRVWHFQTVRHDLWDRDLPTAPTLVSLTRNGRRIDAVVQITKSGLVYVLDRATGESLFPLVEEPAPASDVPGERSAASQVRPTAPPPFARQRLTAELLTTRTPEAARYARNVFDKLRSSGPYEPPSLQGSILFPGMDGGGEWGGAAYDPTSNYLYINSNEMAWILRMKRRTLAKGLDGRSLYMANCAACHGESLQGAPPEFPGLQGVGDRLPLPDLYQQIASGGGRMPAFRTLTPNQVLEVVKYITGQRQAAPGTAPARESASAASDLYVLDGYTKFLDQDGYPAIAPPWGTLNALDLNTGRYVWRIPFGEHPELAAKGMAPTGTENYGGAVVTAGGLLFIGATVYDNKFRAFDKRSGELLWETTLPAAGNATPATYRVRGRQFVVIAAGGGKNPKQRSGGKIIAFALPD